MRRHTSTIVHQQPHYSETVLPHSHQKSHTDRQKWSGSHAERGSRSRNGDLPQRTHPKIHNLFPLWRVTMRAGVSPACPQWGASRRRERLGVKGERSESRSDAEERGALYTETRRLTMRAARAPHHQEASQVSPVKRAE